jgi:hypothetical protein
MHTRIGKRRSDEIDSNYITLMGISMGGYLSAGTEGQK